jgi:hypothetical protein
VKKFEDLTPRAQIGALAAVCILFLATTWTSRFGIDGATIASTVFFAVVALASPPLGILLVVFCTPLRSIFALPKESMQIVLAVGMTAVTLRHLPLLFAFRRTRRPRLLVVLAAFILVYALRSGLELLQHPETSLKAVAQEAAFYVAVLGVALAAYAHATERGFATALLAAACFAILLTMTVDIVNTYFAGLNDQIGWLVYGFPGERFSGLHVNPNATGKFLLLGAFLAIAVLATNHSPTVAGAAIAGLVATTLCFSATSSKSTLLAAVVAVSAWLAVAAWRREWPRALKVLGAAAVMLGTMGLWYLLLAPHAERLAERNLLEFRKPGTAWLDRPAPDKPIARQLEDEMRIGRSYTMTVRPPATASEAETKGDTATGKPAARTPGKSEMYRSIPGKIVYTKRDCGWECTGQRDRLWGTGLAIVGEHWLLGIGPHRWVPEFQARLGFPFDTPHDIVLELWGGYGLAGLALYVALLVLLVRQLARSAALPISAPAFVLVSVTALYIVAMLVAELVDPAKFLAMTPHAIWLWIFAAAAAAGLEITREA